MMAKEPDLSPRDKAISKEEKKDRKHYPQWEHKVTSGLASLDEMGADGWEYLEMWDADNAVTVQNGVRRVGVEPFFIWRRQLD